MRIALLLIFVAATMGLHAQYAAGYKNKGLVELKNTTTIVALTGDMFYDAAIKKAVEAEWKQTPYEFRKMSEINSLISDSKYSFLMPITFTIINMDQHQLGLIMGGKEDISKYTPLHLTAWAIVDGMNLERNMNDCDYRLPHMIKSINDAIDIAASEKISLNVKDKYNTYYTGKASAIKNKTLLINKNYLGPLLKEEDIKASYAHPFQIVEETAIEQAINKKDERFCYLIQASTKNTYTFVWDASTGQVWYAESNDKLGKVEKMKALSDAIGNLEGE